MASSSSSALRYDIPGYRFSPTDTELVRDYLYKKCHNLPLPANFVNDADLYAQHPADIIDSLGTGTEDVKEWYFFTIINIRKSKAAKHESFVSKTSRAVGNIGFWKGRGRLPAEYVKDGDRKIGTKKILGFMEGDAKNAGNTDWVMHEYSTMPESLIESTNDHAKKWVVCRIKLKRSIERCELNTTGPIDIPESGTQFPPPNLRSSSHPDSGIGEEDRLAKRHRMN